jgi:DNA-binding transcriptional ArsR family regulator
MEVLSNRITPEKLLMAANMLRVIAHPVRLSIVDALHQNGRMSVLEIQETLGIEQPIASQHLILMQDKGVLISEKIGRNRFFSLHHPDMFNIVLCLEGCCDKL